MHLLIVSNTNNGSVFIDLSIDQISLIAVKRFLKNNYLMTRTDNYTAETVNQSGFAGKKIENYKISHSIQIYPNLCLNALKSTKIRQTTVKFVCEG